ncbi:virulence factor Mce family protein [Gordonia bronchialis DSM 43247]|uniref:Virulence factor Mce family protein n=1 Tax=Gordonia bronchialis (strain ATCC 25592 / DSM 43247 / BCRC 13721 / JCM 3198 / KCTC 3076 / NBRC 16047 / NCTC 10667) TaxID=526226 RepID=D0LA28_GORB4|nr:MlaD family protein [Gordonia bronchialis]ACY22193.1 virulence factor Mce family protein [Gordonia bronchialis DSM 43247]MCC3324984.1 MCE family protein [Gordonia bronchialis]QGS24259.1 MCE family protein [Gordonia bronchialis]STQ65117.1 virulence factor Mce family protein [Gordonia bronchialis]
MSAGKASIRKPLLGFAIFGVIALLLTYIIYSTLERSVSGSTNTYTTFFNDASGLAKGDDVRMAGVRVGRVDKIELDNGRARVDFEVQKDQPMFTNTKAAIRYQNLIGQRYLNLALQQGAPSQPLSAGSALKLPSEDSFDVSRLLAGFQPVFETLDADQVNALSLGLIKAFQGDDVSLSSTVEEVGRLAADTANRDAVIGAVIDNLSGVMRDLSRQGNQVGTVIQSISTLIGDLNGNSAKFGRVVTDVGKTASGFADVLTRSRADLASAATDARIATRTLIGIGPKLDRLAVELPIFLGHFPLVLGEGSYLNIYACDLDIAIGDVLLPPGLINKIGGTNHSVVCR